MMDNSHYTVISAAHAYLAYSHAQHQTAAAHCQLQTDPVWETTSGTLHDLMLDHSVSLVAELQLYLAFLSTAKQILNFHS
jgi:hypothetical protein